MENEGKSSTQGEERRTEVFENHNHVPLSLLPQETLPTTDQAELLGFTVTHTHTHTHSRGSTHSGLKVDMREHTHTVDRDTHRER